MLPYTEAANPITADIDISNPKEIVKKLEECDKEMFSPKGLDKEKTLFSEDILRAMVKVAEVAKKLIFQSDSGKSLIIMSGCGTSGRIAFMMARTFNRFLKLTEKKFAYTIAGGDQALFTSQEAPEDDRETGKNDLIKACEGRSQILYIGITCGLSAPYVAGQLNHCMENPEKFTPVLLGFNPVRLARDLPIYGWQKTFLKVAQELELLSEDDKAFLINPVVMGEAVTGSSRMKGGSMTKIILETIFLLSTAASDFSISECKKILKLYEETCKLFYESASNAVSSWMSWTAHSFNADGHLYYVGSNGAGVLGIIDATECPPTYGATLDDVRGFICGGYPEYENNEGDLGQLGENYRINSDDLAELLGRGPDAVKHDTLIIVAVGLTDPVLKELQENKKLGSSIKNVAGKDVAEKMKVGVVLLLEKDAQLPELPSFLSEIFVIRLPISDEVTPNTACSFLTSTGAERLKKSLFECCAKWFYNGTSTGAHVRKGKVYKNFMVDLKVSNQKLFHRSIGIIKRFSPGISEDEARNFLLRSIYEVDDVDMTLSSSSILTHIMAAAPKDKVVPTAIVMANRKCSFQESQRALSQFRIIRDALQKLTQIK
ncbi:unnamed protein product [Clavelina lepadiformis]|uniref:SIS domain-containing protein n=1 Tax=Clavelina lepadiformis TaxID=159417 RepID=A0ABP0GHY2_CLALP